ncbi:MAG TPA: HAD-IA family hydrolase [Methylomirabilota bacterium]|nr:HAD-IA family hydrolase [Methylomirabilota bacterium]
MSDRWATFDCYGTLIDWMGGIRGSLARLWPDADADQLLALYHQLEPAVQAGRGLAYRDVMAESLASVATIAHLEVPMGEEDALGASLPAWPVFAEVPAALAELRRRGWRIGILSNTDPDFLDQSLRAIGVPVDLRVVASEIGSYKPAARHWETFFAQTGADRDRHVHVAASLFHDIEPGARLGLRCVWINRLAERSDLPRAADLTDLAALPEALDALVPDRG